MFNVEERTTSYVGFFIAQMDLQSGKIKPVMDEATGGGVMIFRDTSPVDPKSEDSAYNRADRYIDRLPAGYSYQIQRVRVKSCPAVESD